MKKLLLGFGLLLLLVFGVLADGGFAQRSQPPFPSSQRSIDKRPSFRMPPDSPSLNRRLLRESFEKTQQDTAELYDLATALRDEMENATEDVLSVAVMKKAEEIEKLAEKIKNRMKNL